MCEAETAASAAANRLAESASCTDTVGSVEQQDGAQETPVATPTRSVLIGVKSAIEASYVSSRRHLSRRVCQLLFYRFVSVPLFSCRFSG